MPDFGPRQIAWLKQQGYSDDDIAKFTPNQPDQDISKTSTIARELKAKAGGILGGGGGTLAGGAAGAEVGALFGPADPATIPIGAIIGGLIGATGGGAAGSYLGQKAQQEVMNPDDYANLQEEANQAAIQNPKTAEATDIISSALASGGKPSLDAFRAGGALIGKLGGKAITEEGKQALIGTTMGAVVNPAINAGISSAMGEPQDTSDILSQVAGGALFGARQANWASKLTHNAMGLAPKTDEPAPEITNNDNDIQPPEDTSKDIISAFNDTDTEGNYKIGDKQIHKLFKSAMDEYLPVNKDMDEVQQAQVSTTRDRLAGTSVDDKRDFLHNLSIGQQQKALEVLQSREFAENQKSDEENDNETAVREAMANQPDNEKEDNEVTSDNASSKQQEPTPEITQTDKPVTQEPVIYKPEVLQKAIDKGATKPESVQRIFPKLNLTDDEAYNLLTQALQQKKQQTIITNDTQNTQPEQVRSSEPQRNETPIQTNEQGGSKPTTETNRVFQAPEGPVGTKAEKDSFRDGLKSLTLENLQDAYAQSQAKSRTMMGNKDLQGALTEALRGQYFREEMEKRNSINITIPDKLYYGDYSGTVKDKLFGSKFGDYGSGTYVTPSKEFAARFAKGFAFGKDNGSGKIHQVQIEKPKNIFAASDTPLTKEELKFWHDEGEETEGIKTRKDLIENMGGRTVPPEDLRGMSESWDGFLKKFGYDAVYDGEQLMLKNGEHKVTKEPAIPSKEEQNELKKLDLNGQDEEDNKPKSLEEFNSIINPMVKESFAGELKTPIDFNGHNKLIKYAKDTYGLSQPEAEKFAADIHSAPESSPMREQMYYKLNSNKPNGLHDKLERLKVKHGSNLSMGILPAVWNTALTSAQLVLKAGGTIKAAIDKAIEHIKSNHPTPIDEPTIRKHLEATLKGETPVSQNLPPDRYMGKVGSITRAVIDKIHDLNHPAAHLVANAMKSALNRTDELKGRWKNSIVQAAEGLTARDKQQLNAAIEQRRLTNSNTIGMLSSPAARRFYAKAYELLDDSGKYRIKIGEPVVQVRKDGSKFIRNLRQDENYVPTMPNQKVFDIIRNNTDPAGLKNLEDSFKSYNTDKLKLTPDEANEAWDDFTKAIRGDLNSGNQSHQDWFNASRKSMGNPLPPEMREQDPVLNLERYFDRSAIDAGHYEFMEKNPKVMAALGNTHNAWGQAIPKDKNGGLAANKTVQAGLHQWRHEATSPLEQNEHSLSSLITAGFISGPTIETHKVISNVVNSLCSTSNPVVMIKALTHALMNINSGYQTAIENGAVKMSSRSISNMFSATATSAERMQALAKTIRKISSLNDLTNKVGYGLTQAINETIIPSKIERAKNGDVTAQKFLRHLDPNFDFTQKNESTTDIQKLASKMTSYVHGTGDIRSLPAWMLGDSETSGFFSLAHWSMAQTNNFMRNVYEPATRGDIAPLITGIFGAAIGGYIIKDVREKIQGKRNQIPSLSEMAASDKGVLGNPGLLGYNMISAMMYSGFGGLLSQVAKFPIDKIYKNTSQGATFPLDEVAGDLSETLQGVTEAIANDPNVNWVDLASAVTTHILSTDMQLGRIAVNQGINNGIITGLPAEKKELADKMGQLRRFDMTEGLPYNDIDTGEASYMNLEQKKFKSEQDVQKAASELPALIGNIVKTYKDKPDVMMQKIEALKQNEYNTFPNMDKYPKSFHDYMEYLKNLKGTDEANNELQDYMKRNTINQVKSELVP